MANYCPKCGREIKPGIKFCTGCGAPNQTVSLSEPAVPDFTPVAVPSPPPPPPPLPPPPKRSGCGTGCLIGCLIVFLIFILITAILIGALYYFLFLREKEPGSYFKVDSGAAKTVDCEDSLSCLDSNLKKCAPAEGTADLGDFAEVDLEILGASQGNSCVVYVKVIEVKKLPPGLDSIPNFIIEKIFDNLTMECLVPKNIYQQGIEKTGEYIGDDIYEICKGPLFDLVDKFGIEIE